MNEQPNFGPIKENYDPKLGLDAIKQEKALKEEFDMRQKIAIEWEKVLIKNRATVKDMQAVIEMINQRQAMRMNNTRIERADDLKLQIRYQ